jgi:hypothetical protein
VAVWLALWALYLSVVNVGQTFYGFGWETLLLEAGFLAVFLGPAATAPPTLVLWLYRWLLFRVEFGAGLIKLRGDRCWRDLSCLDYHHETQPLPGPLSWFFHHLPRRLHRAEVLANHAAQLVVPFGLLAPQPVATVAGMVVIVTQAWLLASGNFSWLNLITIVLAAAAIDGDLLAAVLPLDPPATLAPPAGWQQAAVAALVLLVAALSVRPAGNLLGRRQLMNASFDPLRLVNTYGAFGAITRVRREVVLEGTDDPDPGQRLEGVPVQGQAGRPAPPPPPGRPLPPSPGLAAVVRGHVAGLGPPLGRPAGDQAPGARPADPEAARPQPVPGRPARPGQGPPVPLPLHHPGRAPPDRRLVVPRAGRRVPPAPAP